MKTSDVKLLLIKLQQEDGRGYSSIKTIRGVLRPAFHMAVDDEVYCKYYEVIYILFHTEMRISEFCGFTIKDVDLTNNIVNVDHQLQRTSDMIYIIDSTKTSVGIRKLPIIRDMIDMFRAIVEDRKAPKYEKIIDGYSGFLFVDKNGDLLVTIYW